MQEPLFIQPVLQEKIWGGTKLRDIYGYDIPSDHTGECWAISAHPDGTGAVENGPYAGTKLDVLYAEHPELFENPTSPVFPLLTKIIDAAEALSVQVHPDDAYGLKHEGELGKTECWYIIDAVSQICYRIFFAQMLNQGFFLSGFNLRKNVHMADEIDDLSFIHLIKFTGSHHNRIFDSDLSANGNCYLTAVASYYFQS